MQTKTKLPRSLAAESSHAIDFLEKISNLLKHQRRHFDDAVVTHCIRLINDYVDDNLREVNLEKPLVADTGRPS